MWEEADATSGGGGDRSGPGRGQAPVGVVCGALAVVAYALTQAVTLPLRPTLVLVCAFGPLLAIGSAGLWELLGRHRRTATLDIGLVANLAAGVAVTLMLLAQLGLKAWLEAGLGGSAQQVSPQVAEAAFQAGNGLQLGRTWPGMCSWPSAPRCWPGICASIPASGGPMRPPGCCLQRRWLG